MPVAQPADQRLRGEVDQHHLVGVAEHRVGHRLPHPHPGQLGDLVVQRLEVLDVDGREDVDPGGQRVGDVLVALAVLEPRRVGVGELVDQRQLRVAREQRRQVHLGGDGAAHLDLAPRHELQPARLLARLRPVVRLQVADHHVAPGDQLGLALLQHPVGLADPRRHPQEDLQPAGHR